MDIGEMHVWFRQYAQQMGMQNVRAILPEQIDLLINTSITDTVNQLIKTHLGATTDKVIADNSKLGQINAFRTLYKSKQVSMHIVPASIQTPFVVDEKTFIKRYYATFENIEKALSSFNYMFLNSFAINYNISSKQKTEWYPVRLIDEALLADTLHDYILRPKFNSPVAVIYNDQIDVYIDNDKSQIAQKLVPNALRISYIATPNTVSYIDEINCDLPPYLHIDILKHAVDLYRISVNGALNGSQRPQQVQQAENARSNYRNEATQ